MESLLDTLSKKETWEEFLEYKSDKNQLSKKEIQQLSVFIAEERYKEICKDFVFSYPVKKEIARMGSAKKRIVYSYSEDETWVLKLLTYKLYKYEDKISENCYSFRRNQTAKTAFDRILKISDLNNKYVLKLDIHNYFNSIDTDQLIKILDEVIDDERLYDFMCYLLKQDRCIYNGEEISENRGAMAGVPLSGFFADIYLKDLDERMVKENVEYYRYADDMIIFFNDMDELDHYYELIREYLNGKNLLLNEEKYKVSLPHEAWEFLGFNYLDGKIDLSAVTIRKMKDRIRRKATKLYRKRKSNNYTFDKTAVSLIRSLDNRFYDLNGDNSFTWTRFYFPVINTSEGLHKIDEYMVSYLRYLYSGRHYKGNYRITYEHLKKLGYTPLVAEYYNWRKDNEILNRINNEAIANSHNLSS
ncbi:MAG: group II intron reverse transcriptase domain-containing protein [Erysipelotrichaceae bacterium]|nr:group II intron reverse transcriptase domain-containing protein [Erysipelotrichaceae bacterium]